MSLQFGRMCDMKFVVTLFTASIVADLRGGGNPPILPPTLFGVKKKRSQKEEKPAGQARQQHPPPSPLDHGLGPPLTAFAIKKIEERFI